MCVCEMIFVNAFTTRSSHKIARQDIHVADFSDVEIALYDISRATFQCCNVLAFQIILVDRFETKTELSQQDFANLLERERAKILSRH